MENIVNEESDRNRDDMITITPNDFDVLTGARGRGYDQNRGNVRYKALIESNLARFREAVTNDEKRQLVLDIVDEIHQNGRFLKLTGGRWYIISREEAMVKVKKTLQDKIRMIRHQFEAANVDHLIGTAALSKDEKRQLALYIIDEIHQNGKKRKGAGADNRWERQGKKS